MLLLTASVVSAAPAAQSGSAATTDNVNLRATPSTSAEILAKLPFGATVTLLGRDNVGGWVRVRTADGKTGWLAARFLSITPGALMNLPVTTAGGSGSGSGQPAASPAEVAAPAPAAAPAGGVRATTTATVNVRSGPGTTSERIARVNFNTELRVQGRNDKGDWVRAALPDGSVGWISAAYVSLPAAQISALPVVSGGGAAALAAPAAPAAPIGPITNTAPVTGFAQV
jgi:N-acetylmuramoyl-L-alanine amidase